MALVCRVRHLRAPPGSVEQRRPDAAPVHLGCDYLAAVAQSKNTFLSPETGADLASIKPGYLFLVRKTEDNWAHIGIVETVQGDSMLTIEENTNDSGSAEGFEVCRRTRGIKNKDYLLV